MLGIICNSISKGFLYKNFISVYKVHIFRWMVIKYITYFNSIALFIFIVGNVNIFLGALILINLFLGALILINTRCMFEVCGFEVCRFKANKADKADKHIGYELGYKLKQNFGYRYITNKAVKGTVKEHKIVKGFGFDSIDIYNFTNEGVFARLEDEGVLKLNVSKDVKKLYRELNISNTEDKRLVLLLPSLGYVTRYRNNRYPSSKFTISV